MCLPENTNIPENIERIINNGFYSHHPFQGSSGQFADLISIFDDIRQLPQQELKQCLLALNTLIEKNRGCFGCYGKGLAYLKHISKDLDDELFMKTCEQYETFSHLSNCSQDFEKAFLKIKQQYQTKASIS